MGIGITMGLTTEIGRKMNHFTRTMIQLVQNILYSDSSANQFYFQSFMTNAVFQLFWSEPTVFHIYCFLQQMLHAKNNIYSTLVVNISILYLKKVVPNSTTSVGHGADLGFLAVSPQVTLAINLPLLSTRPAARKRSPPWPVPNYTAWWQSHTSVNSLPKTTTQRCPARTQTRYLWIASPMPYE